LKNIDIQQLPLSKAKLSAILHQIPVAIAYTDINLKVLKTNPQFFSQFGYTEDIYSLCNLLSQSSSKKFCSKYNCLNSIVQQGRIEHELEIHHKNGKLLWVLIIGTLLDINKPDHGMVWTFNDISSQKTAQEQEQLAATVFEVTGEAMIIFDEKGKIENINPAMQNLIKYSRDELQHQSISLLIDTSIHQLPIEEMLNLVINKGQWKGELFLVKKSKKPFPARMTLNTIKYPSSSFTHFVAILSDISKYKKKEQTLQHRANHDPLTGLPNRNEFFLRLNNAFATAKRNQYKVALLYLDLDGFKPINDTLGHGRGDVILQEVAVKLKNCVREVDTVSRLGGDEFAIILNGTSEEQISSTAERIIQSISLQLEDSLYLSVSIGISLFPTDALNPLKLLQYADEAMYKAKHQGKQSFYWHNSEKN